MYRQEPTKLDPLIKSHYLTRPSANGIHVNDMGTVSVVYLSECGGTLAHQYSTSLERFPLVPRLLLALVALPCAGEFRVFTTSRKGTNGLRVSSWIS